MPATSLATLPRFSKAEPTDRRFAPAKLELAQPDHALGLAIVIGRADRAREQRAKHPQLRPVH